MGFKAKILADSQSPDGVRLTTFQVTYPRIIHAEMMTHRVFSRNAASSRAIPVKKMIASVMDDPYIPSSWGKNQKGMQAGEDVDDAVAGDAYLEWLLARDNAVEQAEALRRLGIHKQLTNRLLEPFLWYTAIFTATEWSNFFHLRNHPMAHPDIATIARMMQELYEGNEACPINYGEWHLPLVEPDEAFDMGVGDSVLGCETTAVKLSAARCARVSYLTHEGKRDPEADLILHDRLLDAGHMSPFEHVARPASPSDVDLALASPNFVYETRSGSMATNGNHHMWFGNFRGWVQYRKTIQGEDDMLKPEETE